MLQNSRGRPEFRQGSYGRPEFRQGGPKVVDTTAGSMQPVIELGCVVGLRVRGNRRME